MIPLVTACAALLTAVAAVIATPVTAFINAKSAREIKEMDISRNALLEAISACTDAYAEARDQSPRARTQESSVNRFMTAACKVAALAGIDNCWGEIGIMTRILRGEYAQGSEVWEELCICDEKFQQFIMSATMPVASRPGTSTAQAKASKPPRHKKANTI